VLENSERLEAMAKLNFSAALRMSMPEIIRQYIHSFDLRHRIKMLRTASRFRRLPRWMPLRPAFSRRVGQRFLSWRNAELSDYLNSTVTGSPHNGNGNGNMTRAPEAETDDTLPSPIAPLDQGSKRKGDAA
jgi:hypothetical protein